jgi:hypothetical protein
MSNVKTASMKEQEERDLKWSKFMEYIDSHITVVDEKLFRDDDPFLVKKLEDAYKVLEEAPIPDWLVRKMNQEE